MANGFIRRRWLKPAALVLIAALDLPAQSGITYVPLFSIERSINANVVRYEARLRADGRLDPGEPVIAYWIMRAEDGRREPLNLLERLKAYGFNIHPDGAGDSYNMTLVAQRAREIHVLRQGSAVHAETLIGGHHAYLQRIFINVKRSILLDTADSAELFGLDVATAQPCQETVHAAGEK